MAGCEGRAKSPRTSHGVLSKLTFGRKAPLVTLFVAHRNHITSLQPLIINRGGGLSTKFPADFFLSFLSFPSSAWERAEYRSFCSPPSREAELGTEWKCPGRSKRAGALALHACADAEI